MDEKRVLEELYENMSEKEIDAIIGILKKVQKSKINFITPCPRSGRTMLLGVDLTHEKDTTVKFEGLRPYSLILDEYHDCKGEIKWTYRCKCGAGYSEGLHKAIIKRRKFKFEKCECGRELREENNKI